MGYERVEVTVNARLSRHNGPRDEEHDRLWDRMAEEIEAVTNKPEYSDITPWRS